MNQCDISACVSVNHVCSTNQELNLISQLALCLYLKITVGGQTSPQANRHQDKTCLLGSRFDVEAEILKISTPPLGYNIINPNRAGSWMLLESGGLNQPTPSRSPQNTDKPNFIFDFLKVHNELGKVTKFWTSRPLFHGEIAI